jgi:NitT/TauT family transport system substrate-binding protein
MAIVLQESLRGLFYAPFYAAMALGAYEKEGVEVRFVSSPTPGAAPDGLFAGTVDVSWAGRCGSTRFTSSAPIATSCALARR